MDVHSVQELMAKYRPGEENPVLAGGKKTPLLMKWQGRLLLTALGAALVLLAVLFLNRPEKPPEDVQPDTANETPTLISHSFDTTNNTTMLVERSFDTFRLRAGHWNNYNNPFEQVDPGHGEYWVASERVSVTDFPANVSTLTPGYNRYTITISGTSDHDMDFFIVHLQGRIGNNLMSLGETDIVDYIHIKANSPFNETRPINIFTECTLADFKEIDLQFINEMQNISEKRHGFSRINGSLSDDIRDGTIMAIIRDFKFSLNG